jgi:hypothetical protein
MLTRKGKLQQSQETQAKQAMYEAMYKTMEMQRATGATHQKPYTRVYKLSLVLGPDVIRQTKINAMAKEHNARIEKITQSVRKTTRKVKLTLPPSSAANPPTQPTDEEPADVASWVDSVFV